MSVGGNTWVKGNLEKGKFRPLKSLSRNQGVAFNYSNIENLFLLVRSEITGYAENKYHGQLELWNIGVMGLAE